MPFFICLSTDRGCLSSVSPILEKVVATLTTDANGYAETGLLEFGEYKVQEVSGVAGYEVDNTVHTVTIAYANQNTPIVKKTVDVENARIATSVKLKKMTEYFDYEERSRGFSPLSSMSAIPFAPLFTQRLKRGEFHSSIEAQALASGRCA